MKIRSTSSKNYFQVSELDDINNELADGNVGIDDIENRWDENPYLRISLRSAKRVQFWTY